MASSHRSVAILSRFACQIWLEQAIRTASGTFASLAFVALAFVAQAHVVGGVSSEPRVPKQMLQTLEGLTVHRNAQPRSRHGISSGRLPTTCPAQQRTTAIVLHHLLCGSLGDKAGFHATGRMFPLPGINAAQPSGRSRVVVVACEWDWRSFSAAQVAHQSTNPTFRENTTAKSKR